MLMPAFDLPTVAGGRLTNDDLAGKPWVAYFSRHTGCYVCQHHLKRALALRSEVQALGGDLLVFMPTRVEHTKEWFAGSDLPQDLTVAMDPKCELFEALGTRHGDLLHNLGKSVKQLWTSRDQISKWRLTRDDMSRMGADLAIAPDGELVFKHICEDPGDRAEPAEVLTALRRSLAATAPSPA